MIGEVAAFALIVFMRKRRNTLGGFSEETAGLTGLHSEALDNHHAARGLGHGRGHGAHALE